MPDTSGRRRRYGRRQTLSETHGAAQFVRVECLRCSLTRYYMPEDILKLVGDVEADAVAAAMRCQKCHEKDRLEAAYVSLSGMERERVRVRRLVNVKMVRRLTWVDRE
jgi:hypothetical protein